MKKVYIVRRNDTKFNGSTVEIPEASLDQTLRVHPTWHVIDESDEMKISPIVMDTPKQTAFHCPICGAELLSERTLKAHKTKKHP